MSPKLGNSHQNNLEYKTLQLRGKICVFDLGWTVPLTVFLHGKPQIFGRLHATTASRAALLQQEPVWIEHVCVIESVCVCVWVCVCMTNCFSRLWNRLSGLNQKRKNAHLCESFSTTVYQTLSPVCCYLVWLLFKCSHWHESDCQIRSIH